MKKPYYKDDLVTIYHGKAEDLAPLLGSFDLLLTDPPYGLAEKMVGGNKAYANLRKLYEKAQEWDSKPVDQALLDELIEFSKTQIIWGGNYFQLPPARGWLIWNKIKRGFNMADGEMAWTNLDMPLRMFDCFRTEYKANVHPSQKPLALMHWCLNFAPEAKKVFDPFMGSGTTLLACKQKGIRCIGIDQSEEYCEIAAERLSQQVLNLFDTRIKTDGPKATSRIQQSAEATAARAGSGAKRAGTAGKKRAETASKGNAGRGGTKSG